MLLRDFQEERTIYGSKLREMELALKESENKFRSLTQSAVDSIVIANSEGKIISWNTSAEKMFGYPEQEVLDRPLDIIMPEKYVNLHNNGMKRYLRTGIKKVIGNTAELEGRRKDGSIFPIELSLSTWKSGGNSFFCGIIRDISERKDSEEVIKKSLAEKEILLKEVHHRVKNNLQIINSLLSIYSKKVDDYESIEMYRECQNKIHSMAIIHDSLYQSEDFENLNLGDYISTLCKHFQQSLGENKIKVKLDMSYVNVPINQAVSLGFILSELLTNAHKHAFPTNEGIISIKLELKGEKIIILFSDDGVGFPKEISSKKSSAFGISLVESLTDQLDGELETIHGKGLQYILSIPIQKE